MYCSNVGLRGTLLCVFSLKIIDWFKAIYELQGINFELMSKFFWYIMIHYVNQILIEDVLLQCCYNNRRREQNMKFANVKMKCLTYACHHCRCIELNTKELVCWKLGMLHFTIFMKQEVSIWKGKNSFMVFYSFERIPVLLKALRSCIVMVQQLPQQPYKFLDD